jgi:hypothetical protein
VLLLHVGFKATASSFLVITCYVVYFSGNCKNNFISHSKVFPVTLNSSFKLLARIGWLRLNVIQNFFDPGQELTLVDVNRTACSYSPNPTAPCNITVHDCTVQTSRLVHSTAPCVKIVFIK